MAIRILSMLAPPLLALTFATSATAAPSPTDYTLDAPRSTFKFLFNQAGAESQGRFRRFNVALRFADDNLAASKLEVTIDVAGLDTGDDERDDTLRSADLFDVKKFPQARFRASKISRVSAGRYEAIGKLTIRNVTRDVRVPFTFRTASEKSGLAAYMTGRTVINRLDYGVGQGEWKATDEVANEVAVTFSLRFTPAAPSN